MTVGKNIRGYNLFYACNLFQCKDMFARSGKLMKLFVCCSVNFFDFELIS